MGNERLRWSKCSSPYAMRETAVTHCQTMRMIAQYAHIHLPPPQAPPPPAEKQASKMPIHIE